MPPPCKRSALTFLYDHPINNFIHANRYVACIYFENYVGLIIGYGVVGGAGSGILFTPANIACVHYFDKHKAVATGIAMSGGGFGTMGVSLLCNYMNITYGYKAYFLTICVISSLTMFFAIFAYFFYSISISTTEDEYKPTLTLRFIQLD